MADHANTHTPANDMKHQGSPPTAGHLGFRRLSPAVKHFKWEESGKPRFHKPPNRTEIVACRHWLEAELVTMKRVVVVALGTVAGSSLVGPAGILVATIRPSAVLRSADADARERAYACR